MIKFCYSLFISALIFTQAQGQDPLADQGIVTQEAIEYKTGKELFYEINGIVSMEAENASYTYGWSPANEAFDIKAMKADSSATWRGGVLRFNIEFSKPGKYAIWILGRKGRHSQYGSNDIKVWFDRNLSLGLNPEFQHRKLLTDGIVDAKGYICTPDPTNNPEGRESEMNFGQTQSFIWMSNPKEGEGPAYWEVKTSGRHHIEFVMGEEYGYAIDKIVLTLNNENQPVGRGPKETVGKSIDPLAKDEVVLPPQWAFGVLYGGYTNQEGTLDRVQSIIDHEYPIDGYWIDSWFWDFTGSGRGPNGYMNFTGDTVAFPDVKSMWDKLESQNVKAGIWIWDIIQQDGNEQVYEEFKRNNAFEREFVNTSSWHNAPKKTLAGQINFNDSNAVDYFHLRMKPLFDQGLDFLKLDRGPGVPFAKGSFEAIQKMGRESKGRALIIQHVGDLDDPAHKLYPTKWSGDSEMAWTLPDYPNLTNYTKGGLTENIEMLAWPNRYDYDVPFLTHDGGGFRIIGSKDYGEELFIRWTQFSMFSPITEIFQSLFNSHSNLGWKYSPRADESFKTHAHLRMRLFPYIYSCAHKVRLYGDRFIKGDGINKHQYLFGSEFLVAPINEKEATTKKVYFPEGQWINYWTGEKYEGNQYFEVPAPLERIPLFVKAGAIVPLRDYARSVQMGNNNHLTLEVYPNGNSTFEMIEDDGETNDYLKGGLAKTWFTCEDRENELLFNIKEAEGSFSGNLTERAFTLKIHSQSSPTSIHVNNKKIKNISSRNLDFNNWYYDEKEGVIFVKLKSTTSRNVEVKILKK